MSDELIRQKARERRFLEQLLDSRKLENYTIPVPIKAELRKYQQVGGVMDMLYKYVLFKHINIQHREFKWKYVTTTHLNPGSLYARICWVDGVCANVAPAACICIVCWKLSPSMLFRLYAGWSMAPLLFLHFN